MKLSAMVSATALVSMMAVLGSVGCGSKNNDDDEDLGTAEAQLIADDSESDDTDSSLESGVDEPLSGASLVNPGSPAEAASVADFLGKVKANAGLFFLPAGCVTTTIDGNTATHVFDHCTGPYGLKSFNGTIVSTYAWETAKLTITHAAQNFQIDGATVSGQRVVVYTHSGTTITKTRTGNWSGTTAKDKAITHAANFVSTWDSSTKCFTRDGSAKTSVGEREHERVLSGYERCGLGPLVCPTSGELVLSRTKNGSTTSVTIDLLGGEDYSVTGPRGRKITRKLACNAQ